MNVNPQDYSRKERKEATWWSSRHQSSFKSDAALKRTRRLTLMDLLLLLVMMGVLIPWFLQMDNRIIAEPYKVSLVEHRRNGTLVLTLKILLPGNAEPIADDSLVGWKILDDEGLLLHQEYDLPPLPGKNREFVHMLSPEGRYSCEITAGSEILVIQVEKD